MAKKRGKTEVYEFLEKLEPHFAYLCEQKKMNQPTRKAFFQQFLGCSVYCYRNWWSMGIKKIYFSILFLLQEVKEHKERVTILQKQLDEITKR